MAHAGSDLSSASWRPKRKPWSEHGRDPLSFFLVRVRAVVQPRIELSLANAERLGSSPAGPPTPFELRAQPCSQRSLGHLSVDLVENCPQTLFARLHVHPSAHDASVLTSRHLTTAGPLSGRA